MSSTPTFEEFVGRLAGLLMVSEQEVIRGELEDLANYDSLGKISLAVLIEDLFGRSLSQDDFSACSTAHELYDLASSKE